MASKAVIDDNVPEGILTTLYSWSSLALFNDATQRPPDGEKKGFGVSSQSTSQFDRQTFQPVGPASETQLELGKTT